MRIVRVVVLSVGVFLLAWVLKEVLGGSNTMKKSEDLVQKIRLNGV